jgi:hypothetical protein
VATLPIDKQNNLVINRFSTSEFFTGSDLFRLSVSLKTSARHGKMDADLCQGQGKRLLHVKKIASGKLALDSVK